MKLLVVTQYFWPENFKVNDLVAELVNRGHNVTVLTGTPSYPDRSTFVAYYDRPQDFESFSGAKIHRVPLVARGGGVRLILNYLSFAAAASIMGPWKVRGVPVDAIFVYEPSPITVGLPGIVFRWLRKAPMVFWVQDLWPETLQAVGVVTSPRVLALVGRLVRFIYNQCDLILAQSRSFIARIAANCDVPERIVYFPNWAEPIYGNAAAWPAPEVPDADGAFTVMFAGNIGDAQNFPAILDAAERLRDRADIRWVIVGDGRMSEWVAAEVVRRGLQARVLLLGRFPVERMPSFYLRADALLVSLKPDPVLSSTIPAKLQTYLAAGVPVLAMMDGEGAATLERAGAGIGCRAGDSAGLAASVVCLAAMPADERSRIGQRGRDITAEEFDRATQIDRLEHWLAELIAAKPHRRSA